MNRHWREGIQPKKFTWIFENKLAVSEQPGGFGGEYKKVRRDVELTWIQNQNFNCMISISPSPQNLAKYKELDFTSVHLPIADEPELEELKQLYSIVQEKLQANQKILLHRRRRTDLMAGITAGYLYWNKLAQNETDAIMQVELIFNAKMGRDGRRLLNSVIAGTSPKIKNK